MVSSMDLGSPFYLLKNSTLFTRLLVEKERTYNKERKGI